MAVTHTVTFEAAVSSSEDGGFDGVTPPPGRTIAEMLAATVERSGVKITKPISQFEAYGWSFTAQEEDTEIECMLQRSDEWLLLFISRTPLLRRLFRRATQTSVGPIAKAIDTFLHQHPQVRNVRWYTGDEFETKRPGHAHP